MFLLACTYAYLERMRPEPTTTEVQPALRQPGVAGNIDPLPPGMEWNCLINCELRHVRRFS